MMEKFMTEEEVKKLPDTHRKSHSIGEFHCNLFNPDKDKEFKADMDFQVNIVWYGSFLMKSNMFEKQVCPVCGKQELIPYFLGASVLSGANIFRGYCLNCHEKIAFWDHDYYLKIRGYIIEHRKELKDNNQIFYEKG